jgi:hypothetical protein
MGYNAVQSFESQPSFWRNMSPPSSGLKTSQARNQHETGSKQSFSCYILYTGFLPDLFFNPECVGGIFRRNVG